MVSASTIQDQGSLCDSSRKAQPWSKISLGTRYALENPRYSSCSAKVKLGSCRSPAVCPRQGDPCLCWGSCASPIVDLTFHVQLPTSQVRCQPPCTGSFACLDSQSSLATCADATSEIGMSRYQNYSSKLCHRFGPFWPRSLHPRGLRMSGNPATATAEHTLELAEFQ